MSPRITVGLPVYKGADLIAKCLECLQQQTFRDFEAIISVDGGDMETAAACRSFLADPRFRMIVQSERLDWVGNFNWLLQQDVREFFCYRQHDDTTAPEFFEILLQAADKEPNAAAIYCDCQFVASEYIEIAPSIEGDSLGRMVQYVDRLDRLSAAPVRGLIRKGAVRQAGLVRSTEYRAAAEVFVWLAKLLRWGNFKRVDRPLYYRIEGSFSKECYSLPEDRSRAVRTALLTGMLEAAIPLCQTAEERRLVRQVIVDRIVVGSGSKDPHSAGRFVAECLERLKREGNGQLLTVDELPPILDKLRRRLDRSRIQRVLYRIRQRSQMAKVIHPRYGIRRVIYQIEGLFVMLRNYLTGLGVPFCGGD